MATDIEIANIALDHVGQKPITSLNPPTHKAGEIIKRHWNVALFSALRIMRPSFAKKQKKIAANASKPTFRYDNRYPLPDDFVALLTVGERGTLATEVDHDIMDGELYINESGSLPITYVFQQTEVAKFDDIFCDVFALKLAARIAKPLGAPRTDAAALDQAAEDLAMQAMSINGQETPPKRIQVSRFRRARTRGSSRYYETGADES